MTDEELRALLAHPAALVALKRQPALLAKLIGAVGKYGKEASLDVLKPFEGHSRASVSVAARAAVSIIEWPADDTKIQPKLMGIREIWRG